MDRIKSICIEEELCQSHDGSLEQILKQMLSYKKLYNVILRAEKGETYNSIKNRLLKRLESSVASFRLTIDRIKKLINDTIETIKNYQTGDCVLNLTEISGTEDFDYDDQNTDFFSVGKKVKIDLTDMDYVSWMRELEKDAENLELLSLMIADITPEHDTKLQTLFDLIRKKIEHPINEYSARD